VWCDPKGRDVIEEYSITGMPHGTPLDPSDQMRGETAGAHMIDAGISSTQHLIRFWGLSPTVPKSRRSARPVPQPGPARSDGPRRVKRTASSSVERTIVDALRNAGLLP
jgi:hypothetical protein